MSEAAKGRGKTGVWKKIAGWGLVVLGVAGCVLPVAPGFPFLLAGLAILAQDYVWARRAMEKTKEVAAKAKSAAGVGEEKSSENEGKASSHVVTPEA